MCSLRDVVVFFAGAEFFHTLSHIILPYLVKLPIDVAGVDFTPAYNYWAIGINGVITLLLLFWASRLKKKEAS